VKTSSESCLYDAAIFIGDKSLDDLQAQIKAGTHRRDHWFIAVSGEECYRCLQSGGHKLSGILKTLEERKEI
jgi:hypothetical protein